MGYTWEMTWVVVGGVVCAVLVVLAGLLIGRAMRSADRARAAADRQAAGSTAARPACACDAEHCLGRGGQAADAGAPTPLGREADDR